MADPDVRCGQFSRRPGPRGQQHSPSGSHRSDTRKRERSANDRNDGRTVGQRADSGGAIADHLRQQRTDSHRRGRPCLRRSGGGSGKEEIRRQRRQRRKPSGAWAGTVEGKDQQADQRGPLGDYRKKVGDDVALQFAVATPSTEGGSFAQWPRCCTLRSPVSPHELRL